MIDIGKNIKEIRVKKGLTQEELGKRIGISKQGICLYENNKRKLTIETIENIARALGVSQYDILKRGAAYYQETEIKLDIDVVKNALNAHKSIIETPLDQVTVIALKELLEYKEIGLTPQAIKEMDKLYLEKCQEVNALVKTCERLERGK